MCRGAKGNETRVMQGSGIYTGALAVKPDLKGRFVLPTGFRTAVPALDPERPTAKQVFITQHMAWPCLLAADAHFPTRIDQLLVDLEERYRRRSLPFNEDDMRGRLSYGEVVPIDVSGRFTMPETLQQIAQFQGHIFYRGMISHFEIWGVDTLLALTDPAYAVIQEQARAAVRAMERAAADKSATKGAKP